VTALPQGFKASGIVAGLKPSGNLDLGMLVSDRQASAAGIFTTNRVAAAPVVLSKRHLRRGVARAIVVNSGNANAATGSRGVADARAMAKATAGELGVKENDVLVASTGVIGVYMPIAQTLTGITKAAQALDTNGLPDLAQAIMTTDTRPKTAEATAGNARVVGIAKGAGMIAPEMATMLCFIATDAQADRGILTKALQHAGASSFDAIDVDGCMSTNDCIIALANGAAGPTDEDALTQAITSVCQSLARQVVEDAEGASKVVTVTVKGAANDREAKKAARALCDSLLLRCAFAGADPNWGRVLAALGASGIPLDPHAIDVWLGGEQMCAGGAPGPGDREKARIAMKERDFELVADLRRGSGQTTMLTNDITPEYVRFNSEYTT
jgi:glutamate N-acetyltransferase/amino-acid N-acetyltransferase